MMWSVITSFLQTNAKTISLWILLAFVSYQQQTISSLKASESILRHDFQIRESNYLEQINVSEIERQKLQASIEKYRQDLDSMSMDIAMKQQELAEARLTQQEQIDNELQKDSSDSNKLKLVERILHEFAN